MKNKLKLITIATFAIFGVTVTANAMEKDTIYNMPADSDFSKYYLPNESQPKKGAVTSADQCMKACEAAQTCVVWTYKPGRFGSPAKCKLSPKLMQENGEKAQFSGAASGVKKSS